MQTTSDEVLIARIAGGDRLAMQVLFARHHVRVYRFVLRLVRNEATAEDLISEVFLDVWRQAGKFEGRSSVSTWMLGIARFKALRFAAEDPKGGGVVHGPRIFTQPTCHHRPDVIGGIGEAEAAEQLRAFFASRR